MKFSSCCFFKKDYGKGSERDKKIKRITEKCEETKQNRILFSKSAGKDRCMRDLKICNMHRS